MFRVFIQPLPSRFSLTPLVREPMWEFFQLLNVSTPIIPDLACSEWLRSTYLSLYLSIHSFSHHLSKSYYSKYLQLIYSHIHCFSGLQILENRKNIDKDLLNRSLLNVVFYIFNVNLNYVAS